jgi:hypothetical protein
MKMKRMRTRMKRRTQMLENMMMEIVSMAQRGATRKVAVLIRMMFRWLMETSAMSYQRIPISKSMKIKPLKADAGDDVAGVHRAVAGVHRAVEAPGGVAIVPAVAVAVQLAEETRGVAVAPLAAVAAHRAVAAPEGVAIVQVAAVAEAPHDQHQHQRQHLHRHSHLCHLMTRACLMV